MPRLAFDAVWRSIVIVVVRESGMSDDNGEISEAAPDSAMEGRSRVATLGESVGIAWIVTAGRKASS